MRALGASRSGVTGSFQSGLTRERGRLAQRWQREHDRIVLEQALELIRGEFEEATWQAFWKTVMEDQSPRQAAKQLGATPNAVRSSADSACSSGPSERRLGAAPYTATSPESGPPFQPSSSCIG